MTTTVRDQWSQGATTFGVWLTVPTAEVAETVARVGFDYCCLDLQHGALDYSHASGMIQAVLLAGSSPIVRVPWNEPGIIGKVLDAGSHGVIVPMVNSADEAAAVVRAVRYPPDGARSYGPILASMRAGSYHQWSNAHVAAIPMIETREAVASIDEILAVPGIDAIYVGPADLSLSLGLNPQNNDGEQAFDDALATIVTACDRAGVIAGIHATPDLAAKRRHQGFRMVTVTNDIIAMRTSLASSLGGVRSAAVDQGQASGSSGNQSLY
jgi:4-hydroxy-2-oxoheptanedioate aldolase